MKRFTIHSSRSLFSVLRTLMLPVVGGLLLLISACDTPEKVLKSTDIEYKKAKAISWYNNHEYYKAIPVLEELIGLMKGRQSTEDLYYMYADANFQQGDYLISAYHFKNYYDLYPTSDKAEECLFMHAKSYEMLSPKPELDQTYTNKAMEAYQLFLNSSTSPKYTHEANDAVIVLRKKLEKKALNAADLYYRTSNFKAASVSYANVLKDFPDIEESERITFMIMKSSYRYAQNSIPARKSERYNLVIKNFKEFKYKFGNSKYLVEASQYEQMAHYDAVKSAFDAAEEAPAYQKERSFNIFFNESEAQKPYITDKDELEDIRKWEERGRFLVVKNNYQLSEEKKSNQKLPHLEQTVKTYYIFVDKYPQSRYSKEAERIFKNTTEQLSKLKGNG